MELSVGAASGLIAVAIALLQFLVPNALTVILVAILSQEQNAVTWSAVSHSLSNSIWPMLLRSDSASSRGVPTKINLVTWSRPLSLAMIAIAAVITPIGLYEDLLPSEEPHLVTFMAVVDTGTLGSGTPPRSDLGFSRGCGNMVELMQCPGTTVVIEVTSDANWTNSTVEGDQPYDRRVPKVLAKLYQSGLQDQPSSVSSFFDIQSRQYQFGSEQGTFTNETYLVDSFKPMGSMIMDDSISLVDGLIVDMSKGSVGFRKHTVPTGLLYGAEWNEDILFLEPETVCVDLNMTFEVQIPIADDVYNPSASSAYLVDKGGWVNMNITNPLQGSWFEDMQTSLLDNGDPSLQVRAYQAGWWNNVQNMYFFNISKPFTNRTAYLNSRLDERYAVNTSSYGLSTKDELLFGTFGNLFDGPPSSYIQSNGSLYISGNYSGDYWSNPWNISSTNYSDIALTCAGALGGDKANMTNIDIKCGLLLGPSKRVDGTDSNVYAPGSWWSRPIYSCASASKATIKTVHFNYNASRSAGLSSLNVTLISDKVYQDKSEMPLWGVEKSNMNLSSVTPFWGLIDPGLENSVNLSTIRAESLYIPASEVTWYTFGLAAKGFNYLPGTEGSPNIWGTIYGATSDSSIGLGFDYTGSTNLAMHQKWQNILTNSTGAAQIINLMWTDYAANYFTGTRSWLTPRDSLPPNLQDTNQKRATSIASASSDGQVPVQVYQRKIRYHLVYGIPAAICLVITALICTVALASIVFRQVTLGRVRYYIYSLSAGRLLGAFLFPNEGDPRADTKTWIDQVGRKPVRLPDPDMGGIGRLEKPHFRSYSLVDQKDSTKVATTTALDIDEGDSGTSHRSPA